MSLATQPRRRRNAVIYHPPGFARKAKVYASLLRGAGVDVVEYVEDPRLDVVEVEVEGLGRLGPDNIMKWMEIYRLEPTNI